MLNKVDIHNILFLDIETVPQHPTYNKLNERMQGLWDKKSGQIAKDLTPEEAYNRAGIYAEFGKICCITVGAIKGDINDPEFRLKSYYGEDEKALLIDFANLLNTHYTAPQQLLCAHNGKEFDFPYICRRMLVNGIQIPEILNIAGKKPWEVKHLDTMELWKFGDYKHYTSLNLLTAIFDIPTPKDDIDGSDVWKVFWEQKDLKRIAVYCQKDVLTIAQLYLRYCGKELISPENVSFS